MLFKTYYAPLTDQDTIAPTEICLGNGEVTNGKFWLSTGKSEIRINGYKKDAKSHKWSASHKWVRHDRINGYMGTVISHKWVKKISCFFL